MFDPSTVAFEIKYPWTYKSTFNGERYRTSFITIWHKDPCRDGTDDSCGWFMRSRHGSKDILKKIESRFAFDWCHDWGGWFNPDGTPRLSVIAITLGMFRCAAGEVFDHNWSKVDRFMAKQLVRILFFAENPCDSLHGGLTGRYGFPSQEERIKEHASCIYGWILRAEQPWCKHPRWHFWHWEFQIHPWQQFKRRVLERCCVCGKGFKGTESVYSPGFNSNKLMHEQCNEQQTSR